MKPVTLNRRAHSFTGNGSALLDPDTRLLLMKLRMSVELPAAVVFGLLIAWKLLA
jgi:hypothetical protein